MLHHVSDQKCVRGKGTSEAIVRARGCAQMKAYTCHVTSVQVDVRKDCWMKHR